MKRDARSSELATVTPNERENVAVADNRGSLDRRLLSDADTAGMPGSAPMKYEPKLAPRDYQREALNKMSGRREFALLMAMRTGKTKTLLDDYGRLELAGEVRDLLVVAPKGVYRTWEDEIEKHLSVDLLSRLVVARW